MSPCPFRKSTDNEGGKREGRNQSRNQDETRTGSYQENSLEQQPNQVKPGRENFFIKISRFVVFGLKGSEVSVRYRS